ncbi:MAG: hypothetical protein M0R77_00740 [Gammaproteobacteria bacterium]|nr:hypothetical protein [Acholeplasmataceae bacterium]MCK9529081.1 hypothetical protein [Gammaproteobacteria bacterium]
MTVLKTAYDTTIGKLKSQDNADVAIKQAILTGELGASDKVNTIMRIKNKAIEEIPALLFPRVLHVNEEERVFVDMRYFTTQGIGLADIRINNRPEFDFSSYWASYQYRWISERPSNLRIISPIGMAAYANWVSDMISKRLSLDIRESIPLKVITAYYYAYQFQDAEFSEVEKNNIFRLISRNLHTPIDIVLQLIANAEPINNLQDYCNALKQIIGSIRLDKLTPGLLLSLVQGSWFGVNAREIIAVALEHPPTWLAIVTSALNNRIYKSTPIMKAIERSLNRVSISDAALTFKRASGVEAHFN